MKTKRKAWQRYVELAGLAKQEQDPQKKEDMMTEFLKIGNEWNFGSIIKKEN